MVEIHLQPPNPFDFRVPDDWPRWKRRFQQFCEGSGLTESAPTKQVCTLPNCLGEEAEVVLTSINAMDDDYKDYSRIIEKFDSYFQVQRNVIYECTRFNRRSQQPGESEELYITALVNAP